MQTIRGWLHWLQGILDVTLHVFLQVNRVRRLCHAVITAAPPIRQHAHLLSLLLKRLLLHSLLASMPFAAL